MERGGGGEHNNHLDLAACKSSGDSQPLQNTGFIHSPVKTNWGRITLANQPGIAARINTAWTVEVKGDLGQGDATFQTLLYLHSKAYKSPPPFQSKADTSHYMPFGFAPPPQHTLPIPQPTAVQVRRIPQQTKPRGMVPSCASLPSRLCWGTGGGRADVQRRANAGAGARGASPGLGRRAWKAAVQGCVAPRLLKRGRAGGSPGRGSLRDDRARLASRVRFK